MNTDHDSTTGDTLGGGSERPARRNGRRNAAIGVTAGLLGGGAIGLLMTMPSLTSAATDTSGADTGATVVALQDDTGADDGTDDTRPEPGVWMRETLQALVDDGTITADQADAVTRHLVENRPERDRPGHGHRRGAAFDGEVVAGLIGIDVDELRAELRSGTSIADIATQNGVDPDAIVQALVDEVSGHLDLAVEDGRLTEDEAAVRLQQAEERITARVNGEHPGRD